MRSNTSNATPQFLGKKRCCAVPSRLCENGKRIETYVDMGFLVGLLMLRMFPPLVYSHGTHGARIRCFECFSLQRRDSYRYAGGIRSLCRCETCSDSPPKNAAAMNLQIPAVFSHVANVNSFDSVAAMMSACSLSILCSGTSKPHSSKPHTLPKYTTRIVGLPTNFFVDTKYAALLNTQSARYALSPEWRRRIVWGFPVREERKFVRYKSSIQTRTGTWRAHL